ncbi:MAG TPA: peptidylprolyl isomerase [Candidatus Baltobacteraceae bacterium]|nr:peptidylprolyl isomerase [Candidatus Baltobacteraceae bacterium]
MSAPLRALALAAAVLLLAAAPRATLHRVAPVNVAIRTADGTIVVRLDPAHAPVTTRNFLHYVDTRAYDGATFYRTVSKANEPQSQIQVIQGGLNQQAPNPMIRPIVLEPTSVTGLHNVDGAISMARTSDPNSATTEFFICIGDNRFLDAGGPLGPGYAAFGKVVSGMDVVRKILRSHANGESLDPPVKILSISRVR